MLVYLGSKSMCVLIIASLKIINLFLKMKELKTIAHIKVPMALINKTQ